MLQRDARSLLFSFLLIPPCVCVAARGFALYVIFLVVSRQMHIAGGRILCITLLPYPMNDIGS
jgi:hypothetical protein